VTELSSFGIGYLSWLFGISDGEREFLSRALLNTDATSYAAGNLHGKRTGIQFSILRNVHPIPSGVSERTLNMVMVMSLITSQAIDISMHDLRSGHYLGSLLQMISGHGVFEITGCTHITTSMPRVCHDRFQFFLEQHL